MRKLPARRREADLGVRVRQRRLAQVLEDALLPAGVAPLELELESRARLVGEVLGVGLATIVRLVASRVDLELEEVGGLPGVRAARRSGWAFPS